MSLYNDLVRTEFDKDTPPEELKNIKIRSCEAVSDLMLGVSAIGSLMFWAADSDDYTGRTAKEDMYRIGAMLGAVSEVVRALGDTSANAEFLHSISGKGSKARADK